jgi:hypothetical protein
MMRSNKRGVRERNTQAERGSLVASFSYLRVPECLGGEGEFSLALDEPLRRLRRAFRAKTMGELAAAAGMTWAAFSELVSGDTDLTDLDDVGEETIGEGIRPELPVDFREWWCSDEPIGGIIQEPRDAAHEWLRRHVPGNVLDNRRLTEFLEWHGSSPGGTISAVTAASRSAFIVLEQVLHGVGFVGVRFRYRPGALDFLE